MSQTTIVFLETIFLRILVCSFHKIQDANGQIIQDIARSTQLDFETPAIRTGVIV